MLKNNWSIGEIKKYYVILLVSISNSKCSYFLFIYFYEH